MRSIDLSADIGESFGDWRMGEDEQLVAELTSANIACGFHAGDPHTMEKSVRICVDHGVAIGAHPGFRDLLGFGRRSIDMTRDEVRLEVLYQLGALQAFATAQGTRLGHVSAHGRLGNLTVTSEIYAGGVLDAIESFDPELRVVGQPGLIHEMARDRGMSVGLLGFPDRAYEDDGTLVSRREPDAVLHDISTIVERAVSLALRQSVVSRNGVEVHVACDSILLHGDNAASVAAAREVRKALEAAGVTLAPV